jgi:hypothetical protein
MMNTKTFQVQPYEELIVSSQQRLPAASYPRKHVHCTFDKLEDAVLAIHALRAAGFDARDISLMASWDYVKAVEGEPQQPRRFFEALMGFLSFLDDSFDIYLVGQLPFPMGLRFVSYRL